MQQQLKDNNMVKSSDIKYCHATTVCDGPDNGGRMSNREELETKDDGGGSRLCVSGGCE